MAKGAFVQRGLMILVCVARFTQVVAMEDGKSFATVHPTPDKYGTQQVQISMVIAYIEMTAMRQISCNEGCMDAKTCFEGNLQRKIRIAAGKKIVLKKESYSSHALVNRGALRAASHPPRPVREPGETLQMIY